MSSKKKLNLGKKSEVTLNIYLDTTNSEKPVVLMPEEEAVLDLKNLPENITVISSTWKRPNWMLQQVIELNAYIDKLVNGRVQRFFDMNALAQARIKVLLLDWSMTEHDVSWALEFEPCADAMDLKVLSMKCMRKIGEIDPPTILATMYAKMYAEFYSEGSPAVQNFLKEKLEKEAQSKA